MLKMFKNDIVWIAAIIPMICTMIVLGIFYQRSLVNLPFAIVDQDSSQVSRELIRGVDETSLLNVVHITTNLQEAQDLLISGEVYGVLLLGSNLQKKAWRQEAPVSKLWTNGQWLLVNNLINKVVAGVFTEKSQRFGVMNPENPIKANVRALYNPSLNYMVYLAWAMIPAIWQIATMLTVAKVFRKGTAELGLQSLLKSLGKTVLWFTLIGTFIQVLFMLRNEISSTPLQWVWWLGGYLLFTLSGVLMSFSWVSLSQNPIMVSSLSAFVGGPALAFSGLTFPQIAMSPLANLWSNLIPLTHLLNIQTRSLVINGDYNWILEAGFLLLCICLFWGALAALSEYRIRTKKKVL
ncbi:ABC transporter permease [Fibrobacterales bacterium]|nr:ABC transporter permease [Fibrobacterales bacterium]